MDIQKFLEESIKELFKAEAVVESLHKKIEKKLERNLEELYYKKTIIRDGLAFRYLDVKVQISHTELYGNRIDINFAFIINSKLSPVKQKQLDEGVEMFLRSGYFPSTKNRKPLWIKLVRYTTVEEAINNSVRIDFRNNDNTNGYER